MPACRTRKLSSAVQDAYEKALHRARLHFGRCKVSQLGSLVVPFTRVNWSRYRYTTGALSDDKVTHVMHVLERLERLVPDATWWRRCAAEASAVNILLREQAAGSSSTAWARRAIAFVEEVLPSQGVSLDIVISPAKLEVFVTYAHCVWQLVLVPSSRAIPLLGFFRMTADGAEPLILGTWSKEFWIRLRDLVSSAEGFTPLAQERVDIV